MLFAPLACSNRDIDWASIEMASIATEREIAVPMRDGARLFANLFRPRAWPTASGHHVRYALWQRQASGSSRKLLHGSFGGQVRQSQLLIADGFRVA
jgi:predicted acyl esterase